MCIPCIAPWLAALLAVLGLEEPLLFSGPIRWAMAALATYRMVDYFRVDDGPFGLHEWIRERVGCYDLDEDGSPRGRIARFLVCPHCQGLLWASVFGILALSRGLWGDVLMVIFSVAGAQSLLHGGLSWRKSE